MPLRLHKDLKIELIKKVPLFAPLASRQLAQVASIADEFHLPEGRVLTQQGERGREFFVLVDGEVEVRRNGRRRATMGAGDFFGEMALVSDRPRGATVTATTPVRVLVVKDSDFRSLLMRMPQIAVKVLEAFVDRLPDADA